MPTFGKEVGNGKAYRSGQKNPSKMFCSILIPVVFKRLYRSHPLKPVAQVSSEMVLGAPSVTRVWLGTAGLQILKIQQRLHYGAPWSQGPAPYPRMLDISCVDTEGS